jgi:hypothetical protein
MRIDSESTIVWPDGTTCFGDELEEMLQFCSDDFEVHPAGHVQPGDCGPAFPPRKQKAEDDIRHSALG